MVVRKEGIVVNVVFRSVSELRSDAKIAYKVLESALKSVCRLFDVTFQGPLGPWRLPRRKYLGSAICDPQPAVKYLSEYGAQISSAIG